MNTMSIYEQLRGVLGEDGAKEFAHTLGTMIEEARHNVRLDRVEAALERLAEAQVRTEARLDRVEQVVHELAEAQARTEARVAELAEAQVRTEARLDRLEQVVRDLAEAQVRTEARLDHLEQAVSNLAEAQARTEQSLRELTEIVKGLAARSDRHEGTLLELRFRDRLPSYLGLYLRRARVLQPADLLDALEPRLERADVEDFLRADVLAQGLVDGAPTYVIGEVSYTADADDVERAARRAALLRKADLPAVGLVACEAVHPQTIAYAREQGVRIWADGRLVDERPATR